jgi:Tfp pilus assembly protein PilF
MTSARKIRLVVCMLAALTAGLSGCGGARARFTSHLDRGKQFLSQGNLDKASIEFRNALQIEPKDPDALYYGGRIAEERRNLGEAVHFYQAAVDGRPGFDKARAGLAKMLLFAGQTKRALAVLEPGVLKHPDNPDLLAARAAARHQDKDDTGARTDAEGAVRADPANEDAVAVLAAIYAETGENAKAIDLVNTAVVKAPAAVALRLILANLYLKADQPQKAEEQMRKIVALKPLETAPRTQLAMHFAKTNQLDAA